MTERARLDVYLSHRAALVDYATPILGERARAEDVVQEAFIRFGASAPARFADPGAYLYRIVRNLALDARRRLRLEHRYSPPDLGEEAALAVPDGRPSQEAELIAREQLASVLAALEELPERTRIALEMHRFGGCKLREIADCLGISIALAHKLVAEGTRHCQRRMRP